VPRILSLLLISLIFLKSNFSFAQNNLRFTHYTTRDGLSNNIITALFQDSRGLLWVGTSNGLNYFDGVAFQNIYPTDFDKLHLHADGINRLAEDAKGNILFITDDGVEEYNWNVKTLRLIFPKTFNGGIYDIKVDKTKNTWLLGKNNLLEYNPQWKLINSIRIDTLETKADKSGSFSGAFFCIDTANNIWFHYHSLICEWNSTSSKLRNKFNDEKKIFQAHATDITQDSSGNFWIVENSSNKNTLSRYYLKIDSIRVYLSLSNNQLMYLYPPNSGKIFISSLNHGLYIFNTKQNSAQVIHHNNSNSPAADYFNAIYGDKNQNLWLASEYGLDKCTDVSANILVLDNFGYDVPLTRSTKSLIEDIVVYKKDLLIFTTGGLFRVNTNNLKRQCFKRTQKKYTFKDNYLLGCFMNNNTILTSTWNGMYVFKLDEKKLQPLPFLIPHPALIDSVPAVSSFKDCKKNIWFGMLENNGIFCWDRTTNNFTKYDKQQTGNHYFPLHHFSNAVEEDDGNIWMGYNKGGMAIFDTASQKFIQPSFSAFTQLNKNVIHCIINDHHGNLWISTSGGLFSFAQRTHQLKHYSRTDGLISNVVMGMAFDKKGVLWMGTYSGLSRFDTLTKQFTNFTTLDGLPDEMIDQVIYDSAINKICFTTKYAVVLFDPYHLTKNIPALTPVITGFYVMSNRKNLNNLNKVSLSSKENFFSFSYTAADFVNPADVKYEYRLAGFNKNWINAGARQYASFTNLSGGNYVFNLRATDDNGMHWYEMAAPISIHIDTPFFKTVWFYVLASAVIIAIIFLFIYSDYRAKLKRIVTALQIRNEIASDLHDDIGSSLSSIMLMSELAKKTHENPETYFDAIKENSGKIIENMNDIVWAVNPNNDTIEQLLIRMQSFASSLLEKKNIALDFIAAQSLAAVKLTMEERKNFYLIFKEAVHNAFKYAECKQIITQIHQHDKIICMTIKDDGRGFDTSIKYTGNGLKSILRRAKEIHGKLEVTSDFNEGTIVTLIFKPTHKGS
jgi:signal transduction histidine kinase/ligand-binding sensor domain-containing protein